MQPRLVSGNRPSRGGNLLHQVAEGVEHLGRSRAVEHRRDATRWRALDATVAATKARNQSVPKEEIDAAIKEALANVRAEGLGNRYR